MINWLLVGYMWLIVHRPHEIWNFLAGYRVVQMYMIVLIAVWLFSLVSSEKRPLGNVFTLALASYILAIAAATLFSPFTNIFEDGPLHTWLRYSVFFVILMTSVKTERDLKIIVTGFAIVTFLYMVDSYRGYMRGIAHYSGGAWRLVGRSNTFGDPNEYGTFIVCALPFVIPLLVLCRKYWHYLFILGYILLSLRSVMLTGSRGAFIMVIALGITLILFSRHRFKLLPIVLIAGMIGWTVMPDDLRNRYRTLWMDDVAELSIDDVRRAEANIEGRTEGFWGGLELWGDYPLFGVGPGQFGTARGHGYRTHNLVGEVTGELGTFGVLTFLFLLACFGINHYNIWKNYKYLQEKNLEKEGRYCWWVSIGVMYAIFMALVQGFSLHNAFWFYWVWFGAFQALAATLMQEKVLDAMQGKLRPSLPEIPVKNRVTF